MAAEVMKIEVESETCCVCGGGGELMTPEEHDAGSPPMQVPLRAMLLHLNTSKVVPDGRLCSNCIRRAMESYEFSTALASRGTPPLSEKIRALRKRLHELTQKIDVFIVVGGAGPDGAYSEEDIIMVERDTLAAAAAADSDELERGRNARGDQVYQCSVCPASFPKPNDFRVHLATHPADSLHSCWTCGAQFATRAALKAHLGASCGSALACQLCGRGAATPAELRRHEAACPARCPACAQLFADRGALAAHAAAAHGRGARPPLVCPTCFRTCDTPELLSAHLLRHRQAKQFVCGYDACILRFATRCYLAEFHCIILWGKEPTTLVIPDLQFVATKKLPSDPEDASCRDEIRVKAYRTSAEKLSNLMSHIRKCHTSDTMEEEPAAPQPEQPAPTTTCEQCGRTFGSVAAMKRHARVHRSTQVNNSMVVQEEGNESQEGEDMEGEVEYLEVEELEEMEYRDDDYEIKTNLQRLH